MLIAAIHMKYGTLNLIPDSLSIDITERNIRIS